MYTATIQKTVRDAAHGDDIVFSFTVTAYPREYAINLACAYATMVEYGLTAEQWQPKDLSFPKEQLYQFIQPATLEQLEQIYPDVVTTGHNNAIAYVQSYIGNMFDIEAMLQSYDTSSTALTLRLALCLSTAIFILASVPNYSEVVEQLNQQLHQLLRGLKSGSRNFGRAGIASDPDVRVSVVSLKKRGNLP